MPSPNRLLTALEALHRFFEHHLFLLGPWHICSRDLPLVAPPLLLRLGSAPSEWRLVASRRQRLPCTLLLSLGVLEREDYLLVLRRPGPLILHLHHVLRHYPCQGQEKHQTLIHGPGEVGQKSTELVRISPKLSRAADVPPTTNYCWHRLYVCNTGSTTTAKHLATQQHLVCSKTTPPTEDDGIIK